MNIQIKVHRSDIGSITQLINLMFQINIEFIDYLAFYNITSILKKFQQTNFALNFNSKKFYKINLNPNEAKQFLSMITNNSNLISQNTYLMAQMLNISDQINKKFSELESQKNNLANQLILTIPKTLNR